MRRKNLVKRTCGVCGKDFETPAWRVRQGKGKYCSEECKNIGKRKRKGVIYDGHWFAKEPSGYYFWKTPNKTSVSLHKYIYEQFNGPVPEGYCVHHKDGNKRNNSIQNLEIMPAREHARHHYYERVKRGEFDWRKNIEKAREAAKAWHASPEGREWHRKHAREVAEKVFSEENKQTLVCTHCGKEYKGFAHTAKRKFCSPRCQTAARVASGVDDETRTCIICGKEFRANKYSSKKTCSKSCKSELLSRRKRGSI